MRDVLAAIGAVSLFLAALTVAVARFDPAVAWLAFEALVPRPEPVAAAAPAERHKPTRNPVIWSNVRLPELTYSGNGGETVTMPDGQVVEEWVTLHQWSGSGPRELATIDIPSDTWRVHYVADSWDGNPFLLNLVGPTDQSFADEMGGDLPRVVYRRGAGRYRVEVALSGGSWDVAIQVPASALR